MQNRTLLKIKGLDRVAVYPNSPREKSDIIDIIFSQRGSTTRVKISVWVFIFFKKIKKGGAVAQLDRVAD